MVQLARNVLKNSIYNSSGIFIGNVAGLILAVILARLLGPELHGIYYLALSVGLLLQVFTDLGVNATLIRYISLMQLEKKMKNLQGVISDIY